MVLGFVCLSVAILLLFCKMCCDNEAINSRLNKLELKHKEEEAKK